LRLKGEPKWACTVPATGEKKYRRPAAERDITPKALALYEKMRVYERKYGPGGEIWWDLNKKLAACFGLFPGMVIYEDPAWNYPRAFQEDIEMFQLLEAALKEEKNRKRGEAEASRRTEELSALSQPKDCAPTGQSRPY
jgi:hypothetical protein